MIYKKFEKGLETLAPPIFRVRFLQALTLQSFAWSTCSGPYALATVNKLHVSEPLSIPGNVTITLDSYLSQLIESPLHVRKISPFIQFLNSLFHLSFYP